MMDLAAVWREAGLVQDPVPEYKFDAKRKWRFDFAWPGIQIAVELDGGAWGVRATDRFGRATGAIHAGRHTSPTGFKADCVKFNRACELGWRVLRYTTDQVLLPASVEQVVRVINDELVVRAVSRTLIGGTK